MSISTRHTVVPFVSGESKAMSGQRLAKVGYKLTDKMKKAGKTAPPSICASVPILTDAQIVERAADLTGIIREALETLQDGIIRNLYETRKFKLDVVSDDDISIDACLNFAAAESGRITMDAIRAWFDSSVREDLIALIAEKLRFTELTEDNLRVCEQHANIYRDHFAGLTADSIVDPKIHQSLRTAIEFAPEDDRITRAMRARLDATAAKSQVQAVALF